MPTPAEARSDADGDVLHSAWGVCSALVGQLAMTLPIDPVTERPVGFSFGGDGTPLDRLADATRALTRRVIDQSGSPFVWHRDRRHAPSRSRMCARAPSATPHALGRLSLGAIVVGRSGGGHFTVLGDTQESFPFFGFLSQSIGEGVGCVCATPHPQDTTRCVVDASTCASLTSNGSALAAACARPAQAYALDDAAAVLAELRGSSGVRCPELGPSDLLWGLAPVGASGADESVHASAWVGTGLSGATYEAARFLHEPRSGLRLSNYAHVNATYHASVSYAEATSTAQDHALPRCFDAEEDLMPPDNGDDVDLGNETELLTRTLFPAAQLLGDSPLVAVCTRYLIEVARATALETTAQARTAALQASAWRRRCGAKLREGAACAASGLLFDAPPPTLSPAAACRSIALSLPATPSQPAMEGPVAYVTPQAHGCVVVDRAARRFFDGPLCAYLAGAGTQLTQWTQLTDACALTPFETVVGGLPPYAMLFGADGARLSPDWLASLAPTFTLDVVARTAAAQRVPSQDRVSHVLDWWPADDEALAVLGLHVTASAHVADEFAPILFDSHFAFDASAAKAFYVHSVLRNASLLPNTLGAGGVCRAPNVGLPLWDANTNRVCTRMPRALSSPADPEPAPVGGEYHDEFCAPTHEDVASTAGGGAAGDVPGWRALTTLTSNGESLYPYPEFPPVAAGQSSASAHPELFGELTHDDDEGWTDACAIAWAPPATCLLATHNCSGAEEVCLAQLVDGNLSQTLGYCASAAIALRVDPTRTPCFASLHCPSDSDVCLADGACAPLHMHAWNRAEHTWDMEVAVLADDCGFPDAAHPYTQSTRGASPWEIVPDLFHMHGFCGHRHWYAYRTAASSWSSPTMTAMLSLAGNTTAWPWIQTRFDGQSSTKPFQTLAEGRALQAVPHPCDQAFMHLQAPTTRTRLQVCAGEAGRTDKPLYTYALAPGNTWAGLRNLSSAPPQTSRWLRTYDEATDATHVGLLDSSDDAADTDVPLGFLGADASAAGDVRSEMAADGASEFFRCTDHMGCSNPHYTFNGVTVDRLDPLTLRGNFSELSLRLCGAVGYYYDASTRCWVDLPLFPLLTQLLLGVDEGCAHLWPRGHDWIVVADNVTSAVLQNSPRTLFCASDASACAYAPRASSQLTADNANDAVASIAQSLNGLWRGAGAAIADAAAQFGATRTYAHINRCAAQLLATNAERQADRQAAYDTPSPSGIYIALRIVLYEVPLPWIHHAMLLALLHTMDASVAAPDWSALISSSSVPDLFLWSDADRAVLCTDDAELDVRPLLWRLLCLNAHPAYTFAAPDADVAFAEAVRARVLRDVQTELPTTTAAVTVQCYTQAAWTCAEQTQRADADACLAALMLAYNDTPVVQGSTVCLDTAPAAAAWLDPCRFPEHFRLTGLENLTLEELAGAAGGMPQGGLAGYLDSLAQAAMTVTDQVVTVLDYITTTAWPPTAATVRPLAFAAQGGFNLSDWLHHGVCTNTYVPGSSCGSQYDTSADDPCVWASGAADLDDRYNVADDNDDDPQLILHYGGGIAPDSVSLCDLDGIDTEAGACVSQYLGEANGVAQSSTCNIQRVQAPAGVEVQGFATDAFAAGGDLCSTSTPRVRSCTWTVLDEDAPRTNAWWSANNTWAGPSLRADLDGLQPYDDARFGQMGAWLPHITTDWQSQGCGLFSGLCAVRVRLAPVTLGVGAGVCQRNRDPRSYVHTVPDCAALMRDAAFMPFVTWRGPNTTLYRCAPCTRYRRQLTANPEARFRCSLGLVDDDDIVRAAAAATAYLTDPSAIAAMAPGGWTVTPALDVQPPAAPYAPLAQALAQWRRRNTDAPDTVSCDPARSPAACFEGPGATLLYALTDDAAGWDTAVANPDVRFTMVCQSQVYGEDQAARCDPVTDTRRQTLRAFVDRQYRAANGVWMPVVPPNMGAAWVSYAAGARTGLFSLMYASAGRAEADVRSAWLLDDHVCAAGGGTALNQRICVRSRVRSEIPFAALHPWLGGDFSPFDGLDVCAAATLTLCPCACAPDAFCGGDNRTLTPQQLARRAREFPVTAACLRQAYASTGMMDAADTSNLCAQAQAPVPTSAQCLQPQGLLGDSAPSRTVSRDELHARAGVATSPADFLVQDLYADGSNGLWAGRTLQQERVTGLERYAFLRMDRARMHPAHIAFTHSEGTGAPLVVAQVALLAQLSGAVLPVEWPRTRAAEADADTALVASLYGDDLSQRRQHRIGDWTCPLRAAAFWGGTSAAFAPIVPAPARASVLFPDLGGAHPLVRSRTARDALVGFVTTQGACFYVRGGALIEDDAVTVAITDPTHPCGLQGMLRALQSGAWVTSQVMMSAAQCTTSVDVPDVSASLRSSEPLAGITQAPCAALPRLAPFQLRTRGDGGPITRRGALTTRSEGGDCHMGRALRYPYAQRLDIAGRTACALTAKSATGAQATCAWQAGATAITLDRVQPLSLPALLAKTAVTYRAASMPPLLFRGPGDAALQEPESSVGLLYATSLARAVAADLAQQCAPAGPWPASTFWAAFASSADALFASNCSVAPPSARNAALYARPQASVASDAAAAYARTWAQPWSWGQVTDASQWTAHGQRFATCNASLQRFLAQPQTQQQQERLMASPISLCEPAPTASLQAFCTAMLQFRTNLQSLNCELYGNGACLYEPGTFYVPYAWSASNQQFAGDTVLAYYQAILLQPRFAKPTVPTYAQLCPQRGAYQQMLAQLSRAQATQCPGYQMEYLKNLLAQFKQVGQDLIHMAYSMLMFFVNAIGATVNANDAFSADAMLTLATHYVGDFVHDAEKVIMPILNAMVSVLFGTSPVGKVMADALAFLCQLFNALIIDFFMPYWCGVVRPAWYVVFSALEHIVGAFDPGAGAKIHAIWVAVAGGDGGIDLKTCLGSLSAIQCNAGLFGINDNASNYLPAPVATRCWADSTGAGGGGPFSGGSDASFLACSGSDTCAQDPLSYDSALIACSACPSAGDAQLFGCDATLKRCTCGPSVRAPDSCLTSSDCAQQAAAQCAVVTDLDNANPYASTSLVCTACGSLGMQPACVRNAAQALGTCACAAVLAASTLQKCGAPGQRVPLLEATGFCLATADLSADLLSPSLTLDFAALSIAPCLLGLSDNGCVNVRLPLASGGAFATPLAVILAPAPPSATYGRRRLLSFDDDADVRLCAREPTRARAKECLHWQKEVVRFTNNASLSKAQRALVWLERGMDNGGVVWPLAAAGVRFLTQRRPLLAQPPPPPPPPPSACTPTQRRRLLQQQASTTFSTLPTLQSGSSIPWSLSTSTTSCPLLDEAFTTVGGAWVDTVAYYAQAALDVEDDATVATPLELAMNESLLLPRPPLAGGLLGDLANTLLLGYGDRIVDAVVTRDASRRLSGRRLVSELSTCNYTELTFGTRASVNRGRGMSLLYIFAATFLAVSLFTTCFIPQGFATRLVWLLLFPMLVFWAAYGIAPTCWPMVPPRFPRDLAAEIGGFVPASLEIPRFLVDARCDVRGNLLLSGDYDPTCFKSCSDDPFLFKSWQDPAAWWLCELSATLCGQAAAGAERWSFLGDFVSSAAFFGEVVAFGAQDPDYTAAFRTCAFFASAELLLSIVLALVLILLFPSLLVAVLEIFGAALVMLSQASASEAAMHNDEDDDEAV